MTPRAGGRRVAVICEVMYPPLDEGIRIYAASLAKALAARHEALLVSERDADLGGLKVHGALADRYFLSSRLAELLAAFGPDAVVYVPWTSLTARTILRAWSLRRYARAARLGVLALQPRRADLLGRMLARRRVPDVVMAVGPGVERQARELRLPCVRIGAGVDDARFRPAALDEREALRRRAGVEPDAFVVLHVGHLKSSRGVEVIGEAARIPGVVCVMVCSGSTRAEAELMASLTRSGVRIVTGYQKRIEDLYRMADAYLFPVTSPLDAIEAPLSVLEAAACGLAIVATPFGALPDLLAGCDAGVVWAESPSEMVAAVRDLVSAHGSGVSAARPRRREVTLSWEHVAADVMDALEGAGAMGRRS